MSKLSFDKFVQLLERSALFEPERLAQIVSAWKSRATLRELSDAQAFADYVVEERLLTSWQCKKLLEGRHRGFFLGKYKLLGHLGSGGMGSVYLAEHVLMQRQVAIKVLPQNRVSDATYLARFHLEAQASAALDHRNIVRAYDLDNDGKIHYLVMEYIEGQDLHALVCQDGPLDCHAAADYAAQAACGLEHAHQRGLVHRDIKPANLLVDSLGSVKILDTGLAKFSPPTPAVGDLAKEEQVLGTADYLAPEQAINSQNVDARADIYALGCTLYFLLTGHPPFPGGTTLERLSAHQHQFPPSILLDRPDAPPELVAMCLRMMEKLPENRFQSAAEVEQALLNWLENEAVAGRTAARSVAAARGDRETIYRHRAPSKANLVSGSGLDLHVPPVEPPPFSAGLNDTDPNLERVTVKMPAQPRRRPGDSSHALPPESDVLGGTHTAARGASGLSSGRHPMPPPVASPPCAPPLSPPLRAADDSWNTRELSLQSGIELPPTDVLPSDLAAPEDAALVWSARPYRPVRTSGWGWLSVLAALVVGALLALVATL